MTLATLARVLPYLAGPAVSFSAVGHFWPLLEVRLTRQLWYVAVLVGAVALARPVAWLVWAVGRGWAVESRGGRRQAVAACVGFAALLACGIGQRVGDNMWLQTPSARAVLSPALWASDVAALTLVLGGLLVVAYPPRPATPAFDRVPLTRGQVGLVGVAALTLAWIAVAVWHFVAHERTAHYWDYAGYWLTCSAYAETLARSPAAAWWQLFDSFGASDYTLLPALPPSLVMAVAGDGRLAYELAVGTLYGGAVALAAVLAVASVARRFGLVVGPVAAAGVAGLAVTCPVIWDPTFRGYLDLGGVALALAVLAVYLSRPADQLRWQHVLAVGAVLAALMLFRRWYSFWVVAFLVVALAEATLVTVGRSRAAGRFAFRLGDWRAGVVAAGIAFVLFAAFAWPTLRRVAATDYADLYAGYRSPADIWERLDSLMREIGYGYAVAYVVAAAVVVARPGGRRAGLFATAMLPVVLAHFYRVQDMGPHHRLLLAPSYLLVGGLALVHLLRAPRAVRVVGLGVVGALAVTGFALNFLPDLGPTRAGLEPWVTRQTTYPEVRDDIGELLALADDAERACAERDATFVVLASSVTLNQTHVVTVRQSLGLPRPAVSRQLILSEVDKVSGFPDTFFDCAVVVAADPPQLHLRAKEQVIVQTLARQVWAGEGLGAAFERLPQVYVLKDGVRAQIFVRRRAFTAREVDDFCRVLRDAHPAKPIVSTPRRPILDAGNGPNG